MYLQYKKQSAKDPGMPKELEDRQARCLEWMSRPSPTASPNASNDEGDTLEEDISDGVACLLGLASNGLKGFEREEGDGQSEAV